VDVYVYDSKSGEIVKKNIKRGISFLSGVLGTSEKNIERELKIRTDFLRKMASKGRSMKFADEFRKVQDALFRRK